MMYACYAGATTAGGHWSLTASGRCGSARSSALWWTIGRGPRGCTGSTGTNMPARGTWSSPAASRRTPTPGFSARPSYALSTSKRPARQTYGNTVQMRGGRKEVKTFAHIPHHGNGNHFRCICRIVVDYTSYEVYVVVPQSLYSHIGE